MCTIKCISETFVLTPYTSDTHIVWAGALGNRHNHILGYEAVGQIVKVGNLVKNFKVRGKVFVSTITPDWFSNEP